MIDPHAPSPPLTLEDLERLILETGNFGQIAAPYPASMGTFRFGLSDMVRRRRPLTITAAEADAFIDRSAHLGEGTVWNRIPCAETCLLLQDFARH